MPLTPFQRKNPHRQVSARNYQTYIERAFEEGDQQAMAAYWADGVVAKAMQDKQRGKSLLMTASLGLAAGLLDEASWLALWGAGGKHLATEENSGPYSLTQGCFNLLAQTHVPALHALLLDAGANPHDCNSIRDTTPFAVVMRDLFGPHHRSAPDAATQAQRASRLLTWARMPGSQRGMACGLDQLIWHAAHHATEEQKAFAEELFSALLDAGAQGLAIGEQSALYRWLEHGAEWMGEWGRRIILSAKPEVFLKEEGPDHLRRKASPKYLWMGVGGHAQAGELLPLLASRGLDPWYDVPEGDLVTTSGTRWRGVLPVHLMMNKGWEKESAEERDAREQVVLAQMRSIAKASGGVPVEWTGKFLDAISMGVANVPSLQRKQEWLAFCVEGAHLAPDSLPRGARDFILQLMGGAAPSQFPATLEVPAFAKALDDWGLWPAVVSWNVSKEKTQYDAHGLQGPQRHQYACFLWKLWQEEDGRRLLLSHLSKATPEQQQGVCAALWRGRVVDREVASKEAEDALIALGEGERRQVREKGESLICEAISGKNLQAALCLLRAGEATQGAWTAWGNGAWGSSPQEKADFMRNLVDGGLPLDAGNIAEAIVAATRSGCVPALEWLLQQPAADEMPSTEFDIDIDKGFKFGGQALGILKAWQASQRAKELARGMEAAPSARRPRM